MSWAARAARLAVYAYQLTLGPVLGGQCRFYPSCSRFALDALAQYGFWRGLAKSIKRFCRCHPFHPGGYDPA